MHQANIGQLKKQNLPQVQLKGKASWQSEVIKLPIQLPGVDIPSMNQDQYNANLELQQPIYQGGINKAKQESENLAYKIRVCETNTSLYALRQRVASLFFQALLVEKQQQVLALHQNSLLTKKKEFEALVEEGMALQQSIDYLAAELISLAQQAGSLRSEKAKIIAELSTLSGMRIQASDQLMLPSFTATSEAEIRRKELELLQLQVEKMEVGQEMTKSQNRPFVYAYATAGYGRPGLNYLSNDFSDYYMVGIQFQWKIWDWQDGKAQRSQLKVQQELVKVQEDEFITEINIAAENLLQEIALLDSLILQDQELIKLRESIAETYSVQVRNGTLTAAAYIEEMNKLQQARLNAELHEVKRALTTVNYLWIKGLL